MMRNFRTENSIAFQGQVCVAGSRTFVQSKIYDEFVEKSKNLASQRVVGDPFNLAVQQGPQVRTRASFRLVVTRQRLRTKVCRGDPFFQIDGEQLDKIISLIESGKKEGATLVTGGARLGDKGYYVKPTVFANVKDDMRIAKEEVSTSPENLAQTVPNSGAQ